MLLSTTSSSRRCDFLFSGLFPCCGSGVSCPVATLLCKFMGEFGTMCKIVSDTIVPDQVEVVDVTSSAGSGVVSEQ